MFPATVTGEGGEKRSVVLLLRWLLVIALGYLVLFHSDRPPTAGLHRWIILGYLLSNLALVYAPRRIFDHRWFDVGLVVTDTTIVSAALFLSGFESQNLLMFYFLIILLAASGKGLRTIIGYGLVVTLVHVAISAEFHGWGALRQSSFLLQIPFLLIATAFYGVLVHRQQESHRLSEAQHRQAREQAEASIRHQAYHDALTALPNRVLFNDRLALGLAHAKRYSQRVGVLFLDLDRFKLINDTAGHATGDQLLRSVAERLTSLLRKSDTVARMGGDEFMLICPELARSEDAAVIAQKVLQVLEPPFQLDGQEYYATASIGVSVYPLDSEDADTLIKHADTALYRAKDQGRNSYQLYSPAMNAKARERLLLTTSLRRALERDELAVHYQPQIDLRDGAVVGAEALVRWRHPDLGMVAPAQFIPLADESGLIVPIGEWVLRTACAQNKAWQTAGFPPLRVAVNLSGRQFRDKNLIDRVLRVLQETGLEPRYLEIELTEGNVMQDPEVATATLKRLSQIGVTISVDDFGTGYSSLGYLKRFPLHTLKIDQCFVRNITEDRDNAAITTAIVAMAQSLKLLVIAEGVETEAELGFLRALRCDGMQGYLFSRPLDAAAFTALLRNKRRLGE
jgi:diguanylate cyclase (GGDEF)-like protein